MTPKEEQLLRHLRDATLALRETRTELEALEQRELEPIAITGIACRLPGGAVDPEAFYRLLEEGRDTVRSMDERWRLVGAEPPPDVPRWAALLDSVEDFDAAFFGISPREAQTLDPQHRLLLEVAWEALEDAGIVPATLRGSRTGVFIGACSADYTFTVERQPIQAKDAYSTTGNMLSIAAGRLSYVLGLQGPCFTIDTACSSSLVATHQACKSLRTRESDLALAGGVNVILAPRAMEALARCQVLSPDGRCRTFDASANGYVRGEGCGIVVLKRLSDARRDGDRIWALLRSSAINQDGRSNGLAAPNVLAQEALIREALAAARVSPDVLDFVETHGTGTALGDPIEVEALRSVLGPPRRDGRPVFLGALKTNIGHLEGGAGVSALIKTVLALHHEKIPRNLNLRTMNPRLRLEGSPLRLATGPVAWPKRETPRFAGISSFGISGTNAHVILEESPPIEAGLATEEREAELITLSGRSAGALRDAARRLRDHLDVHRALALGDLAHALATTRTHFEHRAAVVVSSRDALRDALDEIAGGETSPSVLRGAGATRGRTAFVFTGQGAQVPGSGRALYDAFPAFREALDAACAHLDPCLERPLTSLMWTTPGTPEAALLDRTLYTQPALFALEWALASLWRSLGVTPHMVAGHSIGELAAACVAGVFSLPDACRLVAARGRLMDALPEGGAMVSIAAAEHQVAAALEPFAQTVSIAAVNGPASIVISGAEGDVLSIAERFAARGVKIRRLSVSHAFHSPRMDPVLSGFQEVASSITYARPSIPVISTVSGVIAGAEIASPDYWVKQLRKPVRFADAVASAHRGGAGIFLEVGPRPVLLSLIPSCLGEGEPKLIASLRSERPELEAFLHAVGSWYVQGGAVDWKRAFPEEHVRVRLPTYPFQRERLWVSLAAAEKEARTGAWRLSGEREETVGDDIHHVLTVSTRLQPYLADHVVHGVIVIPGAFYVSAILAVAAERWPGQALDLESVEFLRGLVLPAGAEIALHLVLTPCSDGQTWEVAVSTRAEGAEGAVTHARAVVCPARGEAPQMVGWEGLDPAEMREAAPEELYAGLASSQVHWGPGWRWTTRLRVGDHSGTSIVEVPAAALPSEAPLHPVLVDNSPASILSAARTDDGTPRLPFAIERLRWLRSPAGVVRCGTRLRSGGQHDAATVVAHATLWDDSGVVAILEGLTLRRAPRDALLRTPDQQVSRGTPGDLYRIDWQEVPTPRGAERTGATWLIVPLDGNLMASTIAAGLQERGSSCAVVAPNRIAGSSPTDHVVCVATRGADGQNVLAVPAGLAVLQAVTKWADPPRLWWITHNAMACTAEEDVLPELAALWGLGRTVMQEHPELRPVLLDLGGSEDAARVLLNELSAQDGENQLCVRGDRRYGARLVRVAETEATGQPAHRGDGTVLVTGGLGGIGLQVARWLSERGVPHLLLLGRRGPETPGASEAVAALEARGTQVTVAAADVTDRRLLADVLARLPVERPLRGVVHAAGILDDGLLVDQTPERFAGVLGPKVVGAWNLHQLTADRELDFFWLFSSITGSFGSAGQGSYAAANAFLDGLAVHRRARGLPAMSVAWGPWAGVGMAKGMSAAPRARLDQRGIRLLSPDHALDLLGACQGRAAAQVLVMDLDLKVVERALGEPVPPLWRPLMPSSQSAPAPSPRGAVVVEPPPPPLARWAGMPEGQRQEAMLALVKTAVARVLSLAGPGSVDKDRPLQELGFDSLTAVELRDALGQSVGVALPATLAFDYPTPAAVADYLLSKVPSAPPSPAVVEQAALALDEPIAIIGIGCRFPGGVDSPESFWRLLEEGRDAIIEVPRERWDIDAWYDADPDAAGKMTSRWGGFLSGLEGFDPAFFQLSAREAVSIDPQERLLLETAWEALERAGIVPERLMGSDTGVYVGISGSEYQARTMTDPSKIDAYGALGTFHSAMVGRLSYWLGLKGPNMPVDTACSSSLVAVHLACQALRAGECSLALAAGTNVVLTPHGMVYFSRLRALSPTGRCHTFSADADGYVRAEGAGTVVLERLSDARRNGHPVLAVIRGSAVNQDGRSNGLTAPNGPSQTAVISEALRRAGVEPASIGYLECHGTGTPLGDPIEVQAAAAALGPGRDPAHPLILGSVKTNIGHTEGAAGVAGLIKAVLSLRHGWLPKSLHFRAPNPHISWQDLPVQVASEARAWPRDGVARRAGVSSFGFSGTNVHVVLEEPPMATLQPLPLEVAAPLPFLLSGKTGPALHAQAARLNAHLEAHPELSLGDIAFTLALHRTHFEHRTSIVARDRVELTQTLQALARGEHAASTHTGVAMGRGRIAFLLSGQGSQRPGMGRALYEAVPSFREAFDAVCAELDARLPRPLREVMFASPGTPEAVLIDQTAYTQPALFAFQVALCRTLERFGLRPDYLLGHSVGEIAAAHIAGVLSLEDACRLVIARGRLMQELPPGGAMMAIEASSDELLPLIQRDEERIAVAAINGPRHTVVSGEEEAVLQFAAHFEAPGRRCTRLTTSHAFHSPRMDAMAAPFRAITERLSYGSPRLPLISSLTGTLASEGELCQARYWVAQAREPVQFLSGVRTLEAAGVDSFVEIGPKGILSALAAECVTDRTKDYAFVSLLRGGEDEPRALLHALGALHVGGRPIDFSGVFHGSNARCVELPTYAFQHARYWIEADYSARPDAAASGMAEEAHPALGTAISPTHNLTAKTDSRDGALRLRLEALPVEQRLPGLIEVVQHEAARVLGLPDASALPATRSFRDAGLDSLMAMDLRNRLQGRLEVRINASAIWHAETPALLAAELNSLLGATTTALPPPAPLEVVRASTLSNRPRLAPLSPGQERLWFLDKVLELPETYNLHVALKLSVRIDHGLLKDALDHVVARHEQLRVCFTERNTPLQRVLPWVEIDLPLHDLAALPAEERARTLDTLSRKQAEIPFDLEKPPLFRVSLVRLGVDESALLLTFHHITTDGQSVAVFLRELLFAYEAVGAGREPDLPPVASFLDYSEGSRAWLETEAAKAQRRWWKAELAGLDPLNLATDRQVPGEPSHRGGIVSFQLPASLSDGLEALARDVQGTPFIVLLAAWSALLSRYSRQTDFALGTITLGRNEPGLEDMIGFFVNTVPVRCDLSGDPTVEEYLTRVRARVWSVLDHQELPFQEIVRASATERSAAPSQNHLFRVNFVLEEGRWFQGSFGGATVESLMCSVSGDVEGTAKFDLGLAMVRTGEGYRGSLEYSSDLFNASSIERMVRHFQTLLQDLVHHRGKRISELELLDAAERHQVLFAWNETGAPYPQDRCIHDLIEDQAGYTPDAVALIFGEQQLTYRELNARANQLAHHLRARGVGPDVLVGLCVERSVEMIVGLLGILKAGGAYVALDPALPPERLAFLLEDSRTPFLVTQQHLSEKLPAGAARILCLDRQHAILEGESPENPPRITPQMALAYVLYTSGSTGRPKGVAVEHGNLLNYTFGIIERLGLERGSYATLSTLSADLGNTAIFPCLSLGGTLHVISQELITDAEGFVAYARKHRFDGLKITPSHFRALQSASGARDVFPNRWLIMGGEALQSEWCRKLAEQRPSCGIFNHYGPTETTIGVLTHPMKDVETLELPTLPLGRPLPNSRVYVLDADLKPMPIGVPGELYIGGPGVSRGYWNRPDLTAGKYLPDPYGPEGSRMYRTGDLGRFLEGGELEFLGRIDLQVKVRGYRVELGEIEAVLAQLPGVQTGVVLARDDASGSKRLVAYVVPAPESKPSVRELRNALQARLPDYMVPSTFVFLDAMPLTPNGKADRKALPSPDVARAPRDDRFVPPRTPSEQALVSIWRDVLQVERVGIHDNFFSLGGNSLSVIRIVSRAAQAGYPLKPRDLFAHPTVERLARTLIPTEPLEGAGQNRCLVPLRPEGEEPPLLLVPGIEGTLLGFLGLTRHLRPSIPLWGVEAPEMVGDDSVLTLEELAGRYVSELSGVLPWGSPVRLAGHSLGGSVVLEMARQLSSAGWEVQQVLLLDARVMEGAAFDPFSFLAGVAELLGVTDPIPENPGSLELEGAMRAMAQALERAEKIPGSEPLAFVSRLVMAARKSLVRVRQWTPRAPDVPITLFRTEIEHRGARTVSLYWSERLQRKIEVIPVSGDHFTMLLEPHVADLARRIERRLDRCEVPDEGGLLSRSPGHNRTDVLQDTM